METFENVRKYSKNDVKRLKIFEKLGEIFENIRFFGTDFGYGLAPTLTTMARFTND